MQKTVAAEIEAVHHHSPDPERLVQFQCLPESAQILRSQYQYHRKAFRAKYFQCLSDGPSCPLPGTRQARKPVVNLRVAAQEGNLERAYAYALENVNVIVRDQCPVRKDVHISAAEPAFESKVVYVFQQCRLAAGKRNTADIGLLQDTAQCPPCKLVVSRLAS